MGKTLKTETICFFFPREIKLKKFYKYPYPFFLNHCFSMHHWARTHPHRYTLTFLVPKLLTEELCQPPCKHRLSTQFPPHIRTTAHHRSQIGNKDKFRKSNALKDIFVVAHPHPGATQAFPRGGERCYALSYTPSSFWKASVLTCWQVKCIAEIPDSPRKLCLIFRHPPAT